MPVRPTGYLRRNEGEIGVTGISTTEIGEGTRLSVIIFGMTEKSRIAFLGTGLMGEPMSARLLAAGYPVTVYNRTRQKTRRLQELGAQVSDSPKAAVQSAPTAILMLSDAAAISDVLFKAGLEIEFRERTLLQMGTIAPSESRALEKRIEYLGASYLEAPVLGSTPQAREGKLIVMAGGREALFQKVLPLLRCLGENPRRIGRVGQASALKLALNQLIVAETVGFALSLGLIERNQVPVDSFMEILRESALYAPTFDKKLQRMRQRNFQNPHFPTRHLLKDVGLVLEASAAVGLATDSLESARALLERATERGLSDQDYSSVFEIVSPQTGG